MKKHLLLFAIFILVFYPILNGQLENLHFKYFDHNQMRISSGLTSIIEDHQGRIWTGSADSGICIFNGYSFEYIQHNSEDSMSIPSNRILGLLKLKNDDILIGTPKGVCKYSFENKQITKLHFDHPAYKEWNQFSESLMEDSKGYIWIGSADGLVKYDPKNKQTTVFRSAPNPNGNPNQNINFFIRILQDSIDENRIWCGSQYGLRSFNKETLEFTDHPHPPKWHKYTPSFKNFGTFDLAYSSPNKLWMAAWKSGGLLSYQPKTNEWDQYLFKGGIPSDPYYKNDVMSVLPLCDTMAIFGAQLGIGFIKKGNNELIYTSNLDSLRAGFTRELFIDRNGILWLACEKALVKSTKPIINKFSHSSIPHLTMLQANGMEVDLKNNHFEFESKINQLSFETSVINPIDPEQVGYRIMLEGHDRNWRNTRNQRLVTYSKLSGGKYAFLFESKTPNSEWQKGKSIRINIEKPFYLKPYFFALIAGVLGAIIFAIVRVTARITRREEKVKNEYERKLIAAELTALRSQMNPHFIFNSLNSIYNFILNNDTDNAAEYLVKFSKLMRMVLAHSKKKLIHLSEELKVINLYLELERIRFNGKFKYVIHVEENINQQKIMLPPMLTQPFIENAIWHGIMHKKEDGNLHLSFSSSMDKKALLITILDDGIGRKKSKKINLSKQKKSFGMDITRKRIESFETMFGKEAKLDILDLVDSEGFAAGTEIRLVIPFIHKTTTK